MTLTLSEWFPERADMDRVAAPATFYFAPRPTEGIGLAMLEAMARGQIVVAPDLPTANEYIAHRVSGLLYDPGRPEDPFDLPLLDPAQRRRIGAAARRKMVAGRETWLADLDRLRSIIVDDGRRWTSFDSSAGFGRAIRRAAHERIGHVG